MGQYLEEVWRKKQTDAMRFLQRMRCWEYRQLPTIVRMTHPMRPDKARRLGYKAKQGLVIYRVRVRRGGRKPPAHLRRQEVPRPPREGPPLRQGPPVCARRLEEEQHPQPPPLPLRGGVLRGPAAPGIEEPGACACQLSLAPASPAVLIKSKVPK